MRSNPLGLRLVLASILALAAAPSPPARAAGVSAPDFRVRDLQGREVRLEQFKGRPLVLDFWATWCGPCRAELPHLNALQQKYASRGLGILGLSVDQAGREAVARYVERNDVRFRVAMANRDVLEAYGPIEGIPTTFFINGKGEVVRAARGYHDFAELERYARELW